MERNFKFAVEEIQKINLEDYSDDEFAIARMGFLSDRPNSHGLKISADVLRESAKSVLGKWVVADMTAVFDAGTHTDNQKIVGRIPENQEVEFVVDEDGYTRAYVDTVISKIYARDYCAIFEDDNNRAVSVEMLTYCDEDDEDLVLSFNIVGVTTLGHSTAPSCPKSDITFTRFSDSKADSFFTKVQNNRLTTLETFVKDRKEKMAEEKYVSHPIDTSKKGLYEGEWDGNKAKQDLVKEKNFKTLAPKVCMKLEEGWEDREVTKLGYPVMGLYDGKWRYSAKGLASALGYAKKEEETAVVSKIEKIYKKLGLDSERKEGTEKMSKEIKFAAVDLGDLWSALRSAMNAHSWYYYIDGIYEEDNQKFAIIVDDNDVPKKYRLDFDYTEDGLTVADEITEIKIDFVPTENVKKFAEPENAEAIKKYEKVPDEPNDGSGEKKDEKMSAEDMQAKIDELSRQIEEKENIIMDKDSKMSEMSAELESLRSYKATVLARENACAVDALMSEVKPFIDNEKFAEFKAEGLACTEDTFDAWKNKVQAVCFANVSKNLKKNDLGVFTFAAPVENKELKSGSVWDRIKNHNNI